MRRNPSDPAFVAEPCPVYAALQAPARRWRPGLWLGAQLPGPETS